MATQVCEAPGRELLFHELYDEGDRECLLSEGCDFFVVVEDGDAVVRLLKLARTAGDTHIELLHLTVVDVLDERSGLGEVVENAHPVTNHFPGNIKPPNWLYCCSLLPV